MSFSWKANTPYVLTIDSSAIADSSGSMLAGNDTLKFTTLKESDYGQPAHTLPEFGYGITPGIAIVANETIVEAIPLTSFEWYRKFFRPGEYDIRMLYDTNGNGVWDPGSYKTKKQPEIVRAVTTKEGGKITVRANLDKEYNITL